MLFQLRPFVLNIPRRIPRFGLGIFASNRQLALYALGARLIVTRGKRPTFQPFWGFHA